ncbi:alpha/beta fold hydrolase [Ekhidna sp.]
METSWGKLHYEVFGEGDPLLILHGNSGSTKGKHHLFPELVKDFKVIAMDNRCHGKSECPNGDLDYFSLAEDVYSLMDALGHKKYMIWGHSDGGILGLILGYQHTDKIDRMIISGANSKLTGLEPRLTEIMSNYEQISDPMMRKYVKLMMDQKEIPMDSIKKINVPVMLIVGDRDAVRIEHTLEIFKSLPQANLCVFPTTHFVDHERPDDLIRWIKEFKQPFRAPSTIDVAEEMAKSIFSKD